MEHGPDSVALADAAAAWRGAYVHIPFCSRVCPYCDFAVVAGREGEIERYVAAVLAEIEMEPEWGPLEAVHVGGGTPSYVDPAQLTGIVDALRRRFGIVPGAEVALEANPEDWTPGRAAALVAAGFTRVSFGAQSFDPGVLAYLGRRHAPGDIEQAVAAARAEGFASVSLDLMFGSPPETGPSWRETVRRALQLAPEHVSTYSLTVERGTPLGRAVAAGGPAPDPDVQAERYEEGVAALSGAGLVRYEVSNHARPGHHSRYNLLTWSMGEYLAVGNGAHGHRDGVRRRNVRRLDAYLAAVERGERPEAGRERLDAHEREQERLLVGLRRAAGVTPGTLGEALLGSPRGARLANAGVIARRAGRLVVLRPLLTDEVARAVLALTPGDC